MLLYYAHVNLAIVRALPIEQAPLERMQLDLATTSTSWTTV